MLLSTTVLAIYNLIPSRPFSVARPARHIMGAFHPTLRATPGACVGLRLCRTPCDAASRRNPVAGQRQPPPNHAVSCQNNYDQHSKDDYIMICSILGKNDQGRMFSWFWRWSTICLTMSENVLRSKTMKKSAWPLLFPRYIDCYTTVMLLSFG